MACDKVDGVIGAPAVILIQICTTGKAGGYGCFKIIVSLPKSADIISESVIPLSPTTGEISDLICSAGVPSFCDNFCFT